MPEQGNERNIIGELRSITEKEDMKQSLKSKWGGYTKESVQEYLDTLRKQQQTMAETFSRNQQALYEEKEKFKSRSDTLKNRLRQVETEYRNLSESIRGHKLDGGSGNLADLVALRNKIAALEEELSKSGLEKGRLEKQIELQKQTVENAEQKAEQAAQEERSLREMLSAELQESKKQRDQVLRLSAELEEKNSEIKFLNTLMSEGEHAKLTERLNKLTAQLQEQTEMLAGRNRENDTKSKKIETLRQENQVLKDQITLLTKNLEDMNEQNDKLLLADEALSEQLEAEYKRSLDLIREKSALVVEKLTAVRKLDQAGGKIAMLELTRQKQKAKEEAQALPDDLPDPEPEEKPAGEQTPVGI